MTMRNWDATQRLMMGLACLSATALLGGCHRRVMPPLLPSPILTVYFPPAAPELPAMESSLPDVLVNVPSVKVAEAKPRRIPRRTTSKSPTSEAAVTVDAPNSMPITEEAAIGELSAGGDSSPKTQQNAAQLIASSERRLNGLSPSIATQQQPQLRRIRNFLKQAKQALNTGDAEGAMTLATKAKLLIDDIVK